MFDTHSHLTDPQYNEDREKVYETLMSNPHPNTVIIGCEMEEIADTIQFARTHDCIYYAIGIHPSCADSYDEDEFLSFMDRNDEKLVAIGEIGLDYHEETPDRVTQIKVFDRQIKLAKRLHLPICVHCRDAYGDCMDVLRANAPYEYSGIMHCYSGSLEWAAEAMKMGFYISFSGNVTFKNAERLREVAKSIPLDKLLVETDSPYLSPEGKRGQRNEPANVAYVIDMLAKLHNISYDEMMRITDDNARRVYRIQ